MKTSEPELKSKPVHILHLAESPYLGGITSHILTVAKVFQNNPSFKLHIATLPGRRQDQTLLEQARLQNIQVDTLPMSNTFDVRIAGHLRDYLRKHDIALIHTHNYRAILLAQLFSGRCPVITTVHTAMPATGYRLRFWQWLELQCLKRMPQVIAVSDAASSWLISCGIPAERIRICHNACPGQPVDSDVIQQLRSDYGIPHDAIVAAYAGRLSEGKGLEILLESVAGLPLHLLIAGDGPLRSTLESIRDTLKLKVHFTGNLSNPFPVYALADIVVLPSRMEALPMSLIEAASMGKPVVASNVGGIPEIVTDGITGFMVSYGDKQALRSALERLLDTATREKMGKAAFCCWQNRFTPNHMMLRLEAIYKERTT